MKKWCFLLALPLLCHALCAADLLENRSFETPAEKKGNGTWQHFPAKGWQIYQEKSGKFEIITQGAYDGSRAIRLSAAKDGMVTLSNEKVIPAKAGDQVYFDYTARGKGKIYIRFYWYGKDGKRMKNYFIHGIYVKDAWRKYSVSAQVPENVSGFAVSIDILRTESRVDVDAVDCLVMSRKDIDAASAGVPENADFEVPSSKISNRDWRHYPAKGWEVYANPQTQCDCKVISDAFSGSRAVRLICNDKKSIASLRAEKYIPVKAGDRVYVSCMVRGKGKAYIRLFWYGKNGKKLADPQYFMDSFTVSSNWQNFTTNAKVPEKAVYCELSLEVIASVAEVDFDKITCRVDTGTVLDNGKIKAVINPGVGGGIDSLIVDGCKMDFTQPNQIGNPGGMFTFILPSNRSPGELRFAPAAAEVLIPGQQIRVTQKIDTGKYAGIEAVRVYELLPGSNRIKVDVQLRNLSNKPIETAFRLQSFSSSAPGSFTWPTPDWIQIFHQTGEPLNGLNSIINDLMRAGWIARFYKDARITLLYSYDIKKVVRTYNYMVQQFVTNEWYYRPFTLQPGETWKSETALDILMNQDKPYVDQVAIANNHRLEEIKPIKMPPPPAAEPLPPIFDEFFPAAGGLCNLFQPETAGKEKGNGYYKMFRIVSMRLCRVLTDSYFNTIGGVHLVMNGSHEEYYNNPEKKHEFGEFLRQHRKAFALGRMMYHRKDTDVEAYKKRLPEIIAVYRKPDLQRFVHSYADRLLYINTGDEPLPANLEVMQAAHSELKKYMPKGVPIFTILNSHVVEMMPYMPVFYGDYYPIKRRSSAGANPWGVYPEFADKVKRAGEKPVWFMPQAFAAGIHSGYDIYAYPTDGELRMMVNLALAAGVRGISWYGFPNSGWQWVMNYFHLRYSPLNASGMPGPGWEAIRECMREISGTGMLLLRSRPAALPAGAAIECGTFSDPYGLYNGPAAKIFALKSPKGMVIAAVNHNPSAAEKVTIKLPSTGWDLTALKPQTTTSAVRTLAPGAAVFFYCGNDDAEIDLVFKGRYRAEASRYLIAAARAKGNNIPVIDPWKFDNLPGRAALAALNKEFAALNARIDAAPLGKALKISNDLRRFLGKSDFELTRNLEYVIPKEVFDATPRWQRYVNDKDAAFQQLKEAVIDDFRDSNRITDYLDNGGDAAKILPELEALSARAHKNMDALFAAVAKRRGNRPVDDLRK